MTLPASLFCATSCWLLLIRDNCVAVGRLGHWWLAKLKGLFHPACLARVVSWFAFVVAIFMAHENGDKQRPAKRRHVQGMLDETDPLKGIDMAISRSCYK